MRILELFKGTGSITKWVKENNYTIAVYSLAILKKFNPTWCGDIMEWDDKKCDKCNHFVVNKKEIYKKYNISMKK